MGKQINFYMCENTQKNFIEYLQQNQFEFLDSNSNIVNQPSSSSIFGTYLYKLDYGEIVMRQDNKESMDTLKSPVIQFGNRTKKNNERKIVDSRLVL